MQEAQLEVWGRGADRQALELPPALGDRRSPAGLPRLCALKGPAALSFGICQRVWWRCRGPQKRRDVPCPPLLLALS